LNLEYVCYLDFGKVLLLRSVSRFDDDDEISIGELSVSLIRPQGAAQLIDDEHGDVQNLFLVSSEIVKKNQGVAFWEISGGIRSS
jgi:hypothetical protein